MRIGRWITIYLLRVRVRLLTQPRSLPFHVSGIELSWEDNVPPLLPMSKGSTTSLLMALESDGNKPKKDLQRQIHWPVIPLRNGSLSWNWFGFQKHLLKLILCPRLSIGFCSRIWWIHSPLPIECYPLSEYDNHMNQLYDFFGGHYVNHHLHCFLHSQTPTLLNNLT